MTVSGRPMATMRFMGRVLIIPEYGYRDFCGDSGAPAAGVSSSIPAIASLAHPDSTLFAKYLQLRIGNTIRGHYHGAGACCGINTFLKDQWF